MDEPDGVIGCHGVEIGRGDVAMFGELALVPAGAGDPFAGFDQSDLGLYTGNDFSHRSGIGELDAIEFLDTSFGDVGMCVDQAWGGGMTVEVNDAFAGSIACEFQNFGLGAYFHNDAVANGEGLGHRVLAIYSENMAVKQEQVGTWALRKETCIQ
jgi:hypothetical protein